MEANAYSKYALKDLHESISLIDRKIAHCTHLESFDSQESREFALRKLSTKRAALVKTALALSDMGVQFDPRFLPHSLVQRAESEGSSMLSPVGGNTEMTQTRRKRR